MNLIRIVRLADAWRIRFEGPMAYPIVYERGSAEHDVPLILSAGEIAESLARGFPGVTILVCP